MKTTKKRDMGFSRILFFTVMLPLAAVFGLTAGGAPAGAGVPAATPTRAPAATGAYTQATLLAAVNAATSEAQVRALVTEANWALLGLSSNDWRGYSNFSEDSKNRFAMLVFEILGRPYASAADLKAAFQEAFNGIMF
jgi:hypothetical protein